MYILNIFIVISWLFVEGRMNGKRVVNKKKSHVELPVSILPKSFLYLFVV